MKTIIHYVIMVVLLSIAFIVCIVYEEDIDSFFGYDIKDTAAYETVYIESSFQQKPGSDFDSTRESSNITSQRASISPAIPSVSTPEPISTLIPEFGPAPSPEHTSEPETSPPPSLDLFSCLGIYEDNNGNSIELCLSTELHEMTYGMRFYYNQGMNSLRGRDGYRTGNDYSSIIFTVNFHDEDYPFIIQAEDGYILVEDNNRFGPFDGHEFAGTYYMTKQFIVPDWIRYS